MSFDHINEEDLLNQQPPSLEKTPSITLLWDQIDGIFSLMDDNIDEEHK